METQRYSFQREFRLLRPKEFKFVFDKAERVSNRAFTLLARKNNLPFPRLGMAIAKKHLKKAVDRNLVKRLLREGFRLSRAELDHYDIVVLVKRDIAKMDAKEIRYHRETLWKKFEKLSNRS